jgi:hypothetical protein
MRIAAAKWRMVVSVMIALIAPLWAQDLDAGRSEYLSHCATCHGVDGKGQGPTSAKLKTRPADLTRLAKRNGGVFSPSAVYEAIDGRKTTHGNGEMPVWGCRHDRPPPPPIWTKKVTRPRPSDVKVDRPRPTESHLDLSCDSEPVIRERILAIVEYLRTIQGK